MQVNLAKYPPETAKILHCDIFWFFLCDEDFVSRTITEGSVNMDMFPTSRVYQLVKKFKSSKATAWHIKQIAGDQQATQINLMRQNFPQIDTTRREDQLVGQTVQGSQKLSIKSGSRNLMTTRNHIGHLTTATNVVTPYIYNGSNALQRSTNVKCETNMVTFPVYDTKRKLRCITRTVSEILKHTNCMQVPIMHRTVPIAVILKSPVLMNHFAYSYSTKQSG